MTECHLYHENSISHVIWHQWFYNSLNNWICSNRPYWMINVCFKITLTLSRVRLHLTFHLIPQSLALPSCSLTTLDCTCHFLWWMLYSHHSLPPQRHLYFFWYTSSITSSQSSQEGSRSKGSILWHNSTISVSILRRLVTDLYRCVLPCSL